MTTHCPVDGKECMRYSACKGYCIITGGWKLGYNRGVTTMGRPGARKKHTREDLIRLINEKLTYHDRAHFMVCRDGMIDALAELEKPVLPDTLPISMVERIQKKVGEPRVLKADIAYFFELLRAELTAPPKPKMKTVEWCVSWWTSPTVAA